MRAIGIRATPNDINYVIIEDIDGILNIISIDRLIIPLSLNIPEQLNFVRKTVIDIINHYNVTKAGIKITEGNAQNPSITRIGFEAIIQELFSSCSIQQYFAGNISMTSRLLNIPNDGTFKNLIQGKSIPNDWKFLEDLNNYKREASLAAVAAINL